MNALHWHVCIQLNVGGSTVGAGVGSVAGVGVLEHEVFSSEDSCPAEIEQRK